MDDRALADLLRMCLPEVESAWLFGSAATGNLRKDSDLDIAVYAGPPIEQERLRHCREVLASRLNKDVDLVDLQLASLILAREAIVSGRVLFSSFTGDLFELRVLRDYVDLKYRRAGIEADIRARGRVFGNG